MLDPDIQTLLDLTAAAGGPPAHLVPVADARAAYERDARVLGGPGADVAEVREIALPGPRGPVALRVYRPDGRGPLPLVAYVHGGGWVLGSLDVFDSVCRALANASGCVVASVDYRLAPEHPYPAGPDDVEAAVRWLAGNAAELGADAARFGIAGDSAGGNLATVVARRLRDAGASPLRFQALVYPVCDSGQDTASYRESAAGFGLSPESMARFWDLYLDGADGAGPDTSPLRADLAGLPPAFVLVAGKDVLRDEGEAYAAALEAAGVPVALRVYEGAVHGFFRWLAKTPLAHAAVDEVGAALRAGLA